MIYKCFKNYLLCFGVFLGCLQFNRCFGVIWWFWDILEQKLEETRSCPSNHSRVDIQSQPSNDGQLLSSIDNEARESRLGSQPTYGLSSTLFTRLSLADFNLIFFVFCHFLGKTHFHTFYFTQQIISRSFSSLERRSKTHSKICIGTSVFRLYYIYANYSVICYVMLCYVWVVILVRFRD